MFCCKVLLLDGAAFEKKSYYKIKTEQEFHFLSFQFFLLLLKSQIPFYIKKNQEPKLSTKKMQN